MTAGEHNRDTQSDASQPSATPANPPLLDEKRRDDKPLPRQFETIRDQLEDEQIAKLRAVDRSRATVILRVRGMASKGPMPLAGFVVDFASEAAEEMGTGGPMMAVINPNDGVLEQFAIGFVAPGEINKAGGRSDAVVDALRAELAQMKQDQTRILLMAGGGGVSMKDKLEEMKLFKEIFTDKTPVAPAPDLNAQIANMGSMFSGMFRAMGEGMGAMRQVSQEITAHSAEKSFAGEFKEIMSIPGAPDLAREIVDRTLPPRRATSVAGNRGGGGSQPGGPGREVQTTAEVRDNPLERIA